MGGGITRHSGARYEGAYDGSYEGQFAFHGGPGIPQGIWRNLRGWGEEGGTAAGVEVRDGVDSRAVLKTANLAKRRQRGERTDAFFKMEKSFVHRHIQGCE